MNDTPGSNTRSKKTYDAAKTKETILDAAELIFAEQGYSAARVDAIAKASGYNKSLIYQYYQDKIGLYTEVVKRADQLGDRVLGEVIGQLQMDESLTTDATKFKRYITTIVKHSYQFMLDHPRFMKIFAWEAAEEWKTWNQITYRPDDISLFLEIAKKAKQNGLLRSDLDPTFFPLFLLNNVFFATLTLSRFKSFGSGTDSSAEQDIELAKEQTASFIICGLMNPSYL
ncbi:TetR/AcrR family transcriptional regulator [Cohnella panacarvi]|uniref:TetR/AcrR family transcriptional regulator n=1 Tax=Cohnella panacarvi TaxID=400776 RepID=UPI00047EE9E7|nr:TetR/AcrR family transcriptional regulator [Cohnella panacarvi]